MNLSDEKLIEVGKVIRENIGGKFKGRHHVVSIVGGKNGERVAVLARWRKGRWEYSAESFSTILRMVLWGFWKVNSR